MFNFPETTNQPQTNAPVNNGNGRGNKEPKTRLAYVNMYLPTGNGERVKVVGDLTLGLYLERAAEKQLVDLIKNGTITEDQAGQLIQVEIRLCRDESQPLVLDLSSLGVANPVATQAE